MGTTANYSWPYPESSDFVADGATAIENLADAIDTTVATFGTWTDYTPTLYNFTTNDTPVAQYCRVNDLVLYRFSTSDIASVTTTMEVSLPVTADSTGAVGYSSSGHAFAFDTSLSDSYGGIPYVGTSTRARFWNIPSTSFGTFGVTMPFTWASGDDFRFWMIYRAA